MTLRVGGLCRLLMQVRLLIAGITLLLLAGSSFTVSAALAFVAATLCSWLAIHHWDRIVDVVLRHPILLGLDVVVSFAVLELGGPLGPFFLYTVVTAAVAGLLYHWRGVAYFCSLQIICYYAAVALAGGSEMWSFQALIGQPAYYPLVGFVGVRIRGLLDDQERMIKDRQRADMRAVAANERARLARELHDSLAKTVRGIAMSARALPAWMNRSPQRAAEEAERMASSAEVASREARELISNLRSNELDEPLAGAVHAIAEGWAAKAGIAMEVDIPSEIGLPILTRYEITGILKECLTNIERHANATSVAVSLIAQADEVRLAIQDDGCGFDPGAGPRHWQKLGHFGLVGIHERAKSADGALTIDTSPEQGTTVRVDFALPTSSDDSASVQAVSGEPDSGGFSQDSPTARRHNDPLSYYTRRSRARGEVL